MPGRNAGQFPRDAYRRSLLLFALAVLSASAWANGTDYRIGAGDLLRITVFDHPEFEPQVRVGGLGNITFAPLKESLSVAGLSTREVELLLVARLVEGAFVRNPRVSVMIVDYESQKVSVLGQVAKPGQYALLASNRLVDLIAEAGGVVSGAASDELTILRKSGARDRVDLEALFQGDAAMNVTVSGGDTVFVARAPRFYIYGEVQRPGMYRLERDMTVSRAIAAGGGLTQRGSERRVVVKRRDGNGEEREVSLRQSDALQADDILMVKESWF